MPGRKANILPMTVCASIFTGIGTAFVLMRIFVRSRMKDVFGIDDWLLSTSMIWGLAGYVTQMYCATEYFTRIHLFKEDVGPDERYRVAMGFNTFAQVGICLYSMANMFSRMAILCTYLRFTPREQKIMRFIVVVAVVLTGCLGIGTVLMATASCYPPHLLTYNKDFMDKIARKELKCLAPREVFYYMAIGNVVCDCITFMMPFLLLRKLRNKKMRQELYVLFGFGLIVIIITAVRLPVVSTLKVLKNFSAHNLVKVWIFTMLESNGILVVASIPCLKPLWSRLRGLDIATMSSKSSNSKSGQSDDRFQLTPPQPLKRKIPQPDESILRPTVYAESPTTEMSRFDDEWPKASQRTLC